MSDGTTGKLRFWHPSQDAYHCAFRILMLLRHSGKEISEDMIRLLDLWLLYPQLLHRLSKPARLKEDFDSLKVEKPQHSFLKLPSTYVLFRDVRVYQTIALRELEARSILRYEHRQGAMVKLVDGSVPTGLMERVDAGCQNNHRLLKFLVEDLASLGALGSDGLYHRARLPRRIV